MFSISKVAAATFETVSFSSVHLILEESVSKDEKEVIEELKEEENDEEEDVEEVVEEDLVV